MSSCMVGGIGSHCSGQLEGSQVNGFMEGGKGW